MDHKTTFQDIMLQVVPVNPMSPRELNKIYDEYAPALYGLILRIVKNDLIAEDILLECFNRIQDSNEGLTEKKEGLLRCLLNIAREVALEKVSTKQYRYQLLANELYKCRSYLADPAYKCPQELLKNRKDMLPARLKSIVEMLYFEGLTIHEVSSKLGITQEELKSEVKRALSNIRALTKKTKSL